MPRKTQFSFISGWKQMHIVNISINVCMCVSLPKGYVFHLCFLVKFCKTPSKENTYCKRFILGPDIFFPSEFQRKCIRVWYLKKKREKILGQKCQFKFGFTISIFFCLTEACKRL